MKILFVCLGNICRSAAAEDIMRNMLKDEDMDSSVECDSAGTSGYHSGSPADSRMRQYSAKRGINLTSISRQFDEKKDFKKFDYIIAMDQNNLHDLQALDIHNKHSEKIHMMTSFCVQDNYIDVPDPYYGGDNGFDTVLDILEDGCNGLLKEIKGQMTR